MSDAESRIRILITGASGWLGQFVYQFISKLQEYDVYGWYHSRVPGWIPPTHRIQVDLSEKSIVISEITRLLPHIVIHLAAISSPFVCDKLPDQAFLVNNPAHLVNALNNLCPTSLLIFTSTDLVFNGEKGGPYSTEDTPLPINSYGQSKLAFERSVMQMKHGITLRLSNMIGPWFVYEDVGKKFLQFLFESYEQGVYVGLRSDEKRSFICVHDVVQLIHKIVVAHLIPETPVDASTESSKRSVGEEWSGGSGSTVFHVGGLIGLSRLDLARVMINAINNIHSDHTTLQVDDMPMLVSGEGAERDRSIWRVYNTCQSITAPGVACRSPRDVTMDSSLTHSTFHWLPSDISSSLVDILTPLVAAS